MKAMIINDVTSKSENKEYWLLEVTIEDATIKVATINSHI